jgi:hypothetical protein
MHIPKNKNWLYWLITFIAIATAVSGLLQMVIPTLVLGIIKGDMAPANLHSFAIVGMFMLLFGGMMMNAMLSHAHHPIAVFWSALQKFGAFVAVAIGVLNDLFAPIAWLVALFDLASSLLFFIYWRKIKE